MTRWPAPVVRFYLGQSTAEATLAAAANSDVEIGKNQLCEANFYLGEAALLRGDTDEAKRLFWLAATGCEQGFIEYASAKAELRALGFAP